MRDRFIALYSRVVYDTGSFRYCDMPDRELVRVMNNRAEDIVINMIASVAIRSATDQPRAKSGSMLGILKASRHRCHCASAPWSLNLNFDVDVHFPPCTDLSLLHRTLNSITAQLGVWRPCGNALGDGLKQETWREDCLFANRLTAWTNTNLDTFLCTIFSPFTVRYLIFTCSTADRRRRPSR